MNHHQIIIYSWLRYQIPRIFPWNSHEVPMKPPFSNGFSPWNPQVKVTFQRRKSWDWSWWKFYPTAIGRRGRPSDLTPGGWEIHRKTIGKSIGKWWFKMVLWWDSMGYSDIPCWWMMSWGSKKPSIYWGWFHNPIEESWIEPSRIPWNERGIKRTLNTAKVGWWKLIGNP